MTEHNLKPILRFLALAVLAFATIGGPIMLAKMGQPFVALFVLFACVWAWRATIVNWRKNNGRE